MEARMTLINSDKYHDVEYINLVKDVLESGVEKQDRTGTGTLSVFGRQMRFDLSGLSIPLLTTKKMHTRSVIHEIIWYLRGESNIKYLTDNGVSIWNEWADEAGNLGPIYGAQWRSWPRVVGSHVDYNPDPPAAVVDFEPVDQIATVINQLRNNPNDRRIIVNAWNVGELDKMALPPCHAMFQFYSRELSRGERMTIDGSGHWDGTHDTFDLRGIPRRALSCHLYQRSADLFLGVPFNIVQYSILTHMIAQVTNHVAEEFVWTGGDVHLYNNHIEQANIQMTRAPYPSPQLKLNPGIKEIDNFTFEDFEIIGYNYHPTIKAKVSI
jgi:thymidylate synthase